MITDDIDRLRLLIDDPSQTDETDEALTDDQLQALLDMYDGVLPLAAATALETIAGRLLTVKSDMVQLDGSKQAAVLQARAATLRSEYYDRGGDFYVDFAQTGSDPRFVGDGSYVLGSGGWGIL